MLSADKNFKNIINSGNVLAKYSNDFTVKVDVNVPNPFRYK